jgi:hypothetical protein
MAFPPFRFVWTLPITFVMGFLVATPQRTIRSRERQEATGKSALRQALCSTALGRELSEANANRLVHRPIKMYYFARDNGSVFAYILYIVLPGSTLRQDSGQACDPRILKASTQDAAEGGCGPFRAAKKADPSATLGISPADAAWSASPSLR